MYWMMWEESGDTTGCCRPSPGKLKRKSARPGSGPGAWGGPGERVGRKGWCKYEGMHALCVIIEAGISEYVKGLWIFKEDKKLIYEE